MNRLIKVILFVIFTFTVTTGYAKTKLTFSTVKVPTIEIYEEFIKQAYQQIGIEVQVRILPNARALKMSNDGKVDGEVLRKAGMTKKFPNLIQIPIKIISINASVYSKNKDLKVNGIKSIKTLKIGIIRGIKMTDNLTKGMKRRMVYSLPSLFGVLKKGRVDIVLFIESIGDAFLRSHPEFSMIHRIEPPILKVPLFHYLHKKNQHLIPKITPILEKMIADNVIDKISR